MSVTILLPDGTSRPYDQPVTAMRVAEDISAGLARAAIAAKVDDVLVDLTHTMTDGTHTVQLLTNRDELSLEVLRHSAAHLLAHAMINLYGKDVQYTIGPALTDDFQYGFYYDFDLPEGVSLSTDDLENIEDEMKRLVKQKHPIGRSEVEPETAIGLMEKRGQHYKVEMIRDMLVETPDLKSVSLYQQEDFVDLCRGPHLPDTGKLGKAFKLMSVAGAYWRGDESNKMLTRVYGTAFFDKQELADHLERIEEAKKRDHRVLGKQLGLFLLDEKVGSGMPLWLPDGAILRGELERWLKDQLIDRGYSMVYTPHIGRLDLWQTSGHYPYYRDSQFPPMFRKPQFGTLAALWDSLHLEDPDQRLKTFRHLLAVLEDLNPELPRAMQEDGAISDEMIREEPESLEPRLNEVTRRFSGEDPAGFLLKPMNCPFHVELFKSQPHSYRDLPVRLAEFGQVYRWEQSGELNGLTRVRAFTQDDAHIFCTPEQVEAEVQSCVDLVKLVLNTLELHDYRVRIGLRDPASNKYVGDENHWTLAETNLRHVVRNAGMDYTEELGEAAFYGPKIDFVVKDCIGREWQLGTIQVDYNIPQRFALEYVGADNKTHRPVMIHRAPFGSFERFIGILIEHFGGAFPLWLAPRQVAVLPVSDKYNDYAHTVAARLREQGLRTDLDDSPDKVGAKIRRATMRKLPYMLVVGQREADSKTVAVRARTQGDLGTMDLSDFVDGIVQERDTRGAEVLDVAASN